MFCSEWLFEGRQTDMWLNPSSEEASPKQDKYFNLASYMDEEDGRNLLDETGNTTLHQTAKEDTLKALEQATL